MNLLPNLDPLTPEGRAWHRLTYKPREWIFELGMTRAMDLPAPSLELPMAMFPVLSSAAEIDAFTTWCHAVLKDQTQTQDGIEYMHWFVVSLKECLPKFFATKDAEILKYKALPLMRRRLPDFRGMLPVAGTITVTRNPGAPPEREWDITVHPVDAVGAMMEA